MKKRNRIQAGQLPDGTGHQVSYEQGTSRKVQSFRHSDTQTEPPPHGAGSFHDPSQHHVLMDRVADFLEKGTQ